MTERGDEYLPELGPNGLPADPNWVPPRTQSALEHLARQSEARSDRKLRRFRAAADQLVASGRASPLNVIENAFRIATQACEGNAKLQTTALKAAEFLRDTMDGRPETQVEIEARKVEAKVLVIRDERAKLLPQIGQPLQLPPCDTPKEEASSDSRSSESGA